MRAIEIVTSVLRFRELEAAWSQLWTNENGNAFQSYAWIAAWIAHKDAEYHLRIALVWQNDRLAAVLPLAVHRYYGLRILEWAGQCVTDYCDGLGSAEDLHTAWEALIRHGQIDLVRLKNIPRGAKTQFLATCEGMNFSEDEVCLKVIFQQASSDAWLKSMNSKRRTLYKRRKRLLDEAGTVEIKRYDRVADDTLIPTLHRLKQAWLAAHNQGSYLIDAGPDRLASLVGALAKIGRLHLSVLTCNGVIVAGSINIIHNDNFMVFLITYDSEFSRVSPGNLLMFENMRWAVDSGYRVIDYLRGVEDFKHDWANDKTVLCWVVGVRTRRGKIALVVRRLISASATAIRAMNAKWHKIRAVCTNVKTVVISHLTSANSFLRAR